MRIGNLEIDFPVVQAALSGYSDLPMRRVARMHGATYTLNEVVLDKLVLQKGRKQRAITAVAPDDHPVGGQLMGAEPETFALAADAMVTAGYDVIDINFGCPVRKVLGRCRGGFLLSEPQTALAIVRGVLDAVAGRRPVTVKMRRGMDDTPESERNFFRILDGAFEAGISGVTVHGRTVKQRYVGPSRWDFLARVKRHVGERTVLGSGDLFTAADCIRMMEETGVNGVTVARGCIGNPWIFAECRALMGMPRDRELPSVHRAPMQDSAGRGQLPILDFRVPTGAASASGQADGAELGADAQQGAGAAERARAEQHAGTGEKPGAERGAGTQRSRIAGAGQVSNVRFEISDFKSQITDPRLRNAPQTGHPPATTQPIPDALQRQSEINNAQWAPPSVPDQGRTIARHFAWTVEVYGEQKAGQVMRKFGIKYSELHPHYLEVRDAFIRAKTTDDWRRVLETWYDPAREWPPGVRKTGPGDLVAAGAELECADE